MGSQAPLFSLVHPTQFVSSQLFLTGVWRWGVGAIWTRTLGKLSLTASCWPLVVWDFLPISTWPLPTNCPEGLFPVSVLTQPEDSTCLTAPRNSEMLFLAGATIMPETP